MMTMMVMMTFDVDDDEDDCRTLTGLRPLRDRRRTLRMARARRRPPCGSRTSPLRSALSPRQRSDVLPHEKNRTVMWHIGNITTHCVLSCAPCKPDPLHSPSPFQAYILSAHDLIKYHHHIPSRHSSI
jgi:hypothetical protein